MKFEFTAPKNQKIQSEDLIKDLICVAQKLDKNPTISEYNQNGKYEASVFCRRFGSWNEALISAGLTPNNKQYNDLELFQNIGQVWEAKGKQPARRDMDSEFSSVSSGAYLRRFGTWTNALHAFINYINNEEDAVSSINVQSGKTAHRTTRDINLRLRFKVFMRDNMTCCVCGRSRITTPALELQVDHIKPWSKGGETVLDNLQTLCRDCNLGKSDLI